MRKHRRKNNFFKEKIINFINRNSKEYILLIIIFFIGISLGIIFLNNSNEESKIEISNYINEFVETIKNTDYVNLKRIIYESSKNNIIMMLIICVLGSTVMGMPIIYLVVFYKGFSFAYSVASIIATLGAYKGVIITLAILVPYFVYLPSFISAGVSSLVLKKEIVNSKRRDNLKVLLIRHLLLCLTMLFLVILSSVIQNYIWLFIRPIIVKF